MNRNYYLKNSQWNNQKSQEQKRINLA